MRPRAPQADKKSLESRLRSLQLWLLNLPSTRDPPSYISLLQTCGDLKALPEGRCIHALIQEKGLDKDKGLCHGLITMYGWCGSIENAQRVFDSLKSRRVASWNAIMGSYIVNGHKPEGVMLFKRMQIEGNLPNHVTFLSVLNACDSAAALDEGKSIHVHVIGSGLMHDNAVGSALVKMYSRCEDVDIAMSVFEGLDNKDVVAWNNLITIHARHSRSREALQVYAKMVLKDIRESDVTFVMTLNACIMCGTLVYAMILHAGIVEAGLESIVTITNALLNSYGKCGALTEAQNIFNYMRERSVVSWNTFIVICAQNNFCMQSLDLFAQMLSHNVKRSELSYVAILSTCTDRTYLDVGKLIHICAIDDRLESNAVVGNSLLSMYSNCGSADDAQQMYAKLRVHTVVSWNAMISAYDRDGLSAEAREHFWHMLSGGTVPNEFTFASVISACANSAALEEGNILHALVIEWGLGLDIVVMSALVNMYGKCGSVDEAWVVFKAMSKREWTTWNAMVASITQEGNAQQAVEFFGRMCCEGVEPNEVTFVSILSACSHSGLVDMCCYYFLSMCHESEITPLPTHFCCLVDLFGRIGSLEVAEFLINEIPFQPHYDIWYTLLCACKSQGDVPRGVGAAREVLELHSEYAPAYVSLSNIFAVDLEYASSEEPLHVLASLWKQSRNNRRSYDFQSVFSAQCIDDMVL